MDEDNLIKKEITIQSIKDVVINGTTYYYITDTANNKYRVSITVEESVLPFITSKNKVVVYYTTVEDVIEIIKIESSL